MIAIDYYDLHFNFTVNIQHLIDILLKISQRELVLILQYMYIINLKSAFPSFSFHKHT